MEEHKAYGCEGHIRREMKKRPIKGCETGLGEEKLEEMEEKNKGDFIGSIEGDTEGRAHTRRALKQQLLNFIQN